MGYYLRQQRVKVQWMTRDEYNTFRGWQTPENENGSDMGVLTEDLNGKPNTDKCEGYVQWIPADEFERQSTPVIDLELLTFGEAIQALKKGKKIARQGWNGKGMFLFLLPAGKIPKSVIHDGALASVVDKVEGDHFEALGSIRMWTADGKVLTGWLASQTDMLAEDWEVLN